MFIVAVFVPFACALADAVGYDVGAFEHTLAAVSGAGLGWVLGRREWRYHTTLAQQPTLRETTLGYADQLTTFDLAGHHELGRRARGYRTTA